MGSSAAKFVATPDLKSRLEEWLTKRGKTPSKFAHLRCFGCRAKDFEEKSFVLHRRKVQIATPPPSLLQDSQASPELKGSKQPVSLLESTIIEPDLPEPTEPIEELNCELVLQELSELVAMDYPTDFCKEWLDRIKDQWTESSDNFFYWDILAKLALRNHDTKGAVQYYEEALKKDTQTGYDEYMQAAKKKLNEIKLHGGPSSNKSVFESTIHKFYVHTPQNRRSGPRTPKVSFVATPVRRSARLSVQGQNGCIESLFALSADMRNNLVVKQNQALL